MNAQCGRIGVLYNRLQSVIIVVVIDDHLVLRKRIAKHAGHCAEHALVSVNLALGTVDYAVGQTALLAVQLERCQI